MSTFSDDEVNTLKVTTLVSSIISMIGCVFIIVTILQIRRHRPPDQRTASFSNEPREERHKSSSLLEAQSPTIFPNHYAPDPQARGFSVDKDIRNSKKDEPLGTWESTEEDDLDVPAPPVMVENMQRILQWLSVSDLILGFGFFFSFSNYNYSVCRLQGWLLQFGGFSCFSWTFCMALELYYILIQKNQGATRRLRIYHMVIWSLAFISVFALLAFDQIGPPSPPPYPWCWVVPNTVARFVPFYIPFTLVAFACMALYFTMMRNVQHIYTGAGWSMDRRLFLRLGLYPAIFLLTWVWGLADRIQNAVEPDNPSFFLTFMHSLFTPAQGILDALAYGLTNAVIRRGCRKIIFPFSENKPVRHHEIDKNEHFEDNGYYDQLTQEESDSLITDENDDDQHILTGHYHAMPAERNDVSDHSHHRVQLQVKPGTDERKSLGGGGGGGGFGRASMASNPNANVNADVNANTNNNNNNNNNPTVSNSASASNMNMNGSNNDGQV